MEFRNLKADEIDVRVGSVTSKGYTLLLYKNARVDMAILDETVGAENWQRDHKEVKGNLYCGIGINVYYQIPVLTNADTNMPVYPQEKWIWKWDCGVESQFGDKEKGEASDSFKRAGFNWGIGRELYTSPFIFVNCETESEKLSNGKVVYKLPKDEERRSQSLRVKEISYNEKDEIYRLIIVDSKNVQVFPKSNYENTPPAKVEVKEVGAICTNCGIKVEDKVAKYSKDKMGVVLCRDCQKKFDTIEEKVI